MMKPYPSYKASNVNWLEQIPNNWEILPLKRVIDKFVDYRGHTPNKTDSGILLITARNVRGGQLDFSVSREYIAEEDYDSWMVRGLPEKGDVLVTTEAPLGAIAQIESENVALAQRLILLKANKNRMDNAFIKYYFLSQFGQNELLSQSTGSTAIGIKASKFYNIHIIIPPLFEQRAIADFLDCKTTRIDTLIEKKQQQIDLLQEERTALINHAVTKGLIPNMPMKDSGVEWLGEIPSHWIVGKLKYFTSLITQGPNPNYSMGQPNPMYRVVKTKDLYDFVIHYASTDIISDETYNEHVNSTLEKGDILLAIVGKGSIGKANIFDPPVDIVKYIFTRALGLLRTLPHKLRPHFLKYILQSNYGSHIVDAGIKGSTGQEVIQTTYLKDIYIGLPSIDEQKQIIEFLDLSLANIEKTKSRVANQINMLYEYRSALIFEAVTGKIDVREYNKK